MPAIFVEELSKTFGREARALNNVSVTIEKGEMVALIGASGSGKSTLIRHIAGLIPGDRDRGAGRIEVFGGAVQSGGRIASDVRRSRTRIGVIFQQFNLVSRLSLLTNVVLGTLGQMSAWRGTLGLFSRDEKLRAMEAMRRVDIDRFATQRASSSRHARDHHHRQPAGHALAAPAQAGDLRSYRRLRPSGGSRPGRARWRV